ncbi:MAG: tetratricopeptide repeat protein [Terriglobales bacterium]
MVAIALWVLTTVITRAYAVRQQQLAREWFQRGQADVREGRLDDAVREQQTALYYSHDNFEYRLRLAEALVAEVRTRQGQAYLLALWEEEPGNGMVNLELARLAVQANEVQAALRYFHGAVYGLWQDDPAGNRRAARIELVRFLLGHALAQQAQAELIGVAAGLPPRDVPLMLQVAGLMTQAGDPRRALAEYRDVLALEPDNPDALAGAGKAAFVLQMFPEAGEYLRRAARHSQDPQIATELQQAELVLQMDPYEPRLPAAERERRIRSAFAQAGTRLQQCASRHSIDLDQRPANNPLATDYANWTALQRSVTASNFRRNPEQGDSAMDLVFQIERNTAQACGPGPSADQALMMIAQRHERSMR